MMKSSRVAQLMFVLIFMGPCAKALVGLESLEKKLFEKNQEFLSLQNQFESRAALSSSPASAYYPTLNAVGGWGQNKTDDLAGTEKGYLGYIEGKLNIFRGFKDQAVSGQREIETQLSKIELESKRRSLRTQLAEVASEMIFLHKLQGILEEEFKLTQTQKQMASKKVGAGLTGQVDNLEFDLRESEIQIEQKQIEQRHLETHQKFFEIFGEVVADSEIEKLDFSNFSETAKESKKIEIEKTLEYQKSQLMHARSELEKKEIRSEFLPSLDFTYSVGRLTPSEESPTQFNESKYAVLLTIPLFSGFDTYYKNKAAGLHLASAENLRQQKRNDAEAHFNILKIKAEELSALFQLNEKKLLSLQKYFELTLSEYKRGVKNSPDLVGASERLFSSKKRKYEILKDLELLKVKIENYY